MRLQTLYQGGIKRFTRGEQAVINRLGSDASRMSELKTCSIGIIADHDGDIGV